MAAALVLVNLGLALWVDIAIKVALFPVFLGLLIALRVTNAARPHELPQARPPRPKKTATLEEEEAELERAAEESGHAPDDTVSTRTTSADRTTSAEERTGGAPTAWECRDLRMPRPQSSVPNAGATPSTRRALAYSSSREPKRLLRYGPRAWVAHCRDWGRRRRT